MTSHKRKSGAAAKEAPASKVAKAIAKTKVQGDNEVASQSLSSEAVAASSLKQQATAWEQMHDNPTWELFVHVVKPLMEEFDFLETVQAKDTGGMAAMTDSSLERGLENDGMCFGLVSFSQIGLVQLSVGCNFLAVLFPVLF